MWPKFQDGFVRLLTNTGSFDYAGWFSKNHPTPLRMTTLKAGRSLWIRMTIMLVSSEPAWV